MIFRLVLINFIVMVGLVFGALMDENEETSDKISERMKVVGKLSKKLKDTAKEIAERKEEGTQG
tara:strand:- start:205 stop:396 length:192 start_codon:yes stop_codon:yes gene_type:complete